MCVCVSCPSPAPILAVHPLANSLERQSTSGGGTEIVCRGFRPWCCDTGSSSHFTKLVTSSDPHGLLVTDPSLTHCDRPVPHSLSVLLTPTRAPHARLLKHCEDELSRCWCWSNTHAFTSSLARFHASSLACSHASSLAHFLSGSLLPSHASTLAFFFASSLTFFLSRMDLQFFLYMWPVSAGAESPQAHPASLAHHYHDNQCVQKRRALALVKKYVHKRC